MATCFSMWWWWWEQKLGGNIILISGIQLMWCRRLWKRVRLQPWRWVWMRSVGIKSPVQVQHLSLHPLVILHYPMKNIQDFRCRLTLRHSGRTLEQGPNRVR